MGEAKRRIIPADLVLDELKAAAVREQAVAGILALAPLWAELATQAQRFTGAGAVAAAPPAHDATNTSAGAVFAHQWLSGMQAATSAYRDSLSIFVAAIECPRIWAARAEARTGQSVPYVPLERARRGIEIMRDAFRTEGTDFLRGLHEVINILEGRHG